MITKLSACYQVFELDLVFGNMDMMLGQFSVHSQFQQAAEVSYVYGF